MDVFVEQIVKKRPSTVDMVKKSLVIVGVVILMFLCYAFFPFLGSFALLIVAGVIYLAWWLLTSMNIEHEYIVTNEEIDIDRIVAQRKRKRVLTVKITNFDSFGKYNPQEHQNKNYQTKIDASALTFGDDTYFATFHHPKKGHTLLLFSPNEKVLASIEPVYKRKVMFRR